VTVTVESKQLGQNSESPSKVCMCEVSTQQWPSTQNTLFERTRQIAWLDAVTIPLTRSKWILAYSNTSFEVVEKPKKLPKTPRNALATKNLWNHTQASRSFYVISINLSIRLSLGPNILRSCFLYCPIYSHTWIVIYFTFIWFFSFCQTCISNLIFLWYI